MNICKKKPASALLVLADSDEILHNSTIPARIARMNEVYKKDINQPFAIQYSSIHKSAFDGNLSGIQYFLRKGKFGKDAVYVDSFDMRGAAASHIACERGHVHVITYLLTNSYAKANPNLRSTVDGSTPLMIACREGQLDCVTTLLSHGAKPFEKNRSGLTASHFAVQGDHLECIQAIFGFSEQSKLQLEEEEKAAKAAVAAYTLSIQEDVPTERRPIRREMWVIERAKEAPHPRLLVPDHLLDDDTTRKLKKELSDQEQRKKQLTELTDPSNMLLVSVLPPLSHFLTLDVSFCSLLLILFSCRFWRAYENPSSYTKRIYTHTHSLSHTNIRCLIL